MEKTALEIWLDKLSDNRRFEDLFFILFESIENKTKDTMVNYQKTSSALVRGLVESSRINSWTYTYRPTLEPKSTIYSCFDLLLELAGKKVLTENNHIYLLDNDEGRNILSKHGISLTNKSYLNTKLSYFCSEKSSKYRSLMEKNQTWMDNFILDIREFSKNTDYEIIFNQRNYSIIFFCASIELGYEPSKKEILETFDKIWNNLTYHNRMELSFFCEYFAKTNVFKNSLAPAKNIELLLKNFFKGYLNNCDDNQPDVRETLYLHEDKLIMLYNHPSFLHENIQKQFLRKNAQKFLGKNFASKEEQELISLEVDKEKPKTKKMKI